MSRKTCKTKQGQRARTAIRACLDVEDLAVLSDFVRAHKQKLVTERFRSRQLEIWLAMTDGLYTPTNNVIRHGILEKGRHYWIQMHRGRKHRGMHVSAYDGGKTQWLDFTSAGNLRLVEDGEEQDDTATANTREFAGRLGRLMGA